MQVELMKFIKISRESSFIILLTRKIQNAFSLENKQKINII